MLSNRSLRSCGAAGFVLDVMTILRTGLVCDVSVISRYISTLTKYYCSMAICCVPLGERARAPLTS